MTDVHVHGNSTGRKIDLHMAEITAKMSTNNEDKVAQSPNVKATEENNEVNTGSRCEGMGRKTVEMSVMEQNKVPAVDEQTNADGAFSNDDDKTMAIDIGNERQQDTDLTACQDPQSSTLSELPPGGLPEIGKEEIEDQCEVSGLEERVCYVDDVDDTEFILTTTKGKHLDQKDTIKEVQHESTQDESSEMPHESDVSNMQNEVPDISGDMQSNMQSQDKSIAEDFNCSVPDEVMDQKKKSLEDSNMLNVEIGDGNKYKEVITNETPESMKDNSNRIVNESDEDEDMETLEKHEAEVEDSNMQMDIFDEKSEGDGRVVEILDASNQSPAIGTSQATDEPHSHKEMEITNLNELTDDEVSRTQETSKSSPSEAVEGLDGKATPKTGSAERRMKSSSKGFSLGNIVSRLKIQVESKQEETDVSEVKKETGDSVLEKTQSKRSEQKQQGKQMRAAAHAAMLLYEDVESDEDSCNKVDDTGGIQTDGVKDMENYANNTMDELLGLYGYDAQNRNEKDDVQLCSSLSNSKIPITGSVQSVKPNQKQNQLHKPSQDTGLVITNVTSMASSQDVKEKNLQETEKKNSNYCAECSVFVDDGVMLIASDQCFCSQSCLDKYQSRQTLVCDYCSGMITQAANQKFVRETREGQKKFCSQPCSEEFSKRVRNCNTCGKEIAKTSEGILAPVGSGGKFVDFCKQECVDNYGKKPLAVKQGQAKQEGTQPRYWAQDTFFVCAVCSNYAKAKHVISLQGKLNGLCSSDCFAQFKDKNQLAFSLCSQCNALCSNQKVMRSIEIEGKMLRFCSMRCFKMKLKKSMNTIACAACKKPNWAQSMIEEWNGTELVRFFCSTGCLSKRDAIPFTSSCQQNSTKTLVTTTAKTTAPTQKQAKLQPTPQVPPSNVIRTAAATSVGGGNKCDHCSKHQRPQYHLTMSDNSIRNFCTYGCVIAFQAQFNVPPVTLPQETLQLTCSNCQARFSNKPLALDFKEVVNVFCSQNCLDEFKRVNSVVMECDYCHLEKILHERIYFSGQARSFCSEGCKLLFKQQFAQRLGLRCTVCDYCAQTCRSRVERMYGNNKKKFCSMACKSQYDKWLSKGAKCDGCKCTGRKLEESFIWRGDMKRVCNQHCLLLFYTQQNIPNMNTQTQSTIPAIQFTQSAPKTTTPVITNVMSLAPSQQQQAGAPANNVKYQQKVVSQHVVSSNIVKKCHKQTQITTAAPKQVKPPPPPVPLPPAPKMVKNKMTLVKPFSQTKSVSCRPLTSTKGTITDDQPPLVIPIPVPVYVPVPMHMYTTPVPHPMTLPVPVPVPVFIPVAYNNADRLLACIKEIKEKIPSDPLEAEMLMLADAIAGDDGGQLSTTEEILDTTSLPTLDGEDLDSLTLDDTEEVIPSQLLADNILKMAADITHGLEEEPENELQDDLTSLQYVEPKADLPARNTRSKVVRSSVRRGRSRGNKRTCVEEPSTSDSEQTSVQVKRSKEEARNSIGINAYRYFVSQKKKKPTGKELKGLTLSTNILDVSTEELGYVLCSMCKEGTQPDGAKYSPDILLLIFLSIQHHLSENGRPENMFTDLFYRHFTDELHDEIKEWTIEYHPTSDEILNTCINEETLWNAKQLGAHSPYILLSTMIYFNAKHFQLKTLDQHKALAFCRIQKHIRKIGMTRTMFLRYYPADRKKVSSEGTSKRKRDRDSEDSLRLEQSENIDNPLRCPVRLYEFYLSKCPDSVRSHSELFYLVPERSCVPDSPVWYSSSPLGDHEMNKILTRMLMVTDIHNAWTEMTDDIDE